VVKNKNEARISLGLPLEKKIILSPRSFEYRCNLHIVLEAFAKLTVKDKNIYLVFIGGQNNKDYYEMILNKISELDLGDNVRIDNTVSNDKIINYYSACDLGISFARSDGFPNSVLELMYCKVPVIVGNIPHVKELLKDNVNSLLSELDVNSLVEKLEWTLKNLGSEKLNYITKNAYSTISEFGNIEKNAAMACENIKSLKKNSKKGNLFLEWILLLLYFGSRKIKLN
jgi:glycosyltransferase involved in cell wall biosynthesis